jgi:iron complex outermembrane receptor protein
MPGFPPINSAANSKHSPKSKLDDIGVGAYAQTTLTAWEKLDAILGLRGDYESKKAGLNTFYAAPDTILPLFGISTVPTSLSLKKNFSDVTPQFALAYHFNPDAMVYANMSRGYRAGGFNPLSPGGKETYNPETSWNYELGAKTAWLDNRLSANLAFFYIDWQHLQLNLPMNTVDMQYYIANAGGAHSKGVELELNARPVRGWDIFGGFSYTDAKFCCGAAAMWNNATALIVGNRLIFTPEYTVNGGMQYAWAVSPEATLYARAEVVAYSSYYYNPVNTASQSAYSLTNFRTGVRGKHWNAEACVSNAFDTDYIPIALEYGAGRLVGENGPPRIFGFRVWVNF